MAEIDITVNDRESFDKELPNLISWCLEQDEPLDIAASHQTDNGHAVILYSYKTYNPYGSVMNALRTSFDLGKEVFDVSDRLNQQLLEAGKLVHHSWVKGATHVFTIQWGTWAGTKKPAHSNYYGRMTNEEAFITAIKFNADLRSLKDKDPSD